MLMALLGLTFILMMPPILQTAEKLIAKGVSWTVILRVLLTLVPQALSVTIPMALLYGVLFGLGRLSADREFVALQACGVSVFRLFRPIALLSILACGATAYETIVALPDANQTFREITFNIVASGAESDIKTARVLHQLPEPRDLRPRHPAGHRLARRVPRRRDAARAHDGVRGEVRTAGHRPRQADGRARARERHAAHDVARPARGVRQRRVRVDGAQHERRHDLPARPDREGRQREDDRRTASDRPRERRPSRAEQQPTLHDSAEILAALRLLRPGAHRRGVRRDQQQGGQAGELRPRDGRGVRLLRAALFLARRSSGRPAARRAGPLARQRCPRRRGHRVGDPTRRIGGPAHPADASATLGRAPARRLGTGRGIAVRRPTHRHRRQDPRTSTGRVPGCWTCMSRASTCRSSCCRSARWSASSISLR